MLVLSVHFDVWPGGSDGKESASNARMIPESERSPGERNG